MIDEHMLILVLALLLDRMVGDPAWLWTAVPHPVVIFGKAIAYADRRLNLKRLPGSERRRNGGLAIALLLVVAAVAGLVVHGLLHRFGWFGIIAEVMVVAIFMAQKSLADHVNEVSEALR